MPPPAKTIEPFEELQATLLRLINCYAAHPCGRLATHISYQVEKLLGHPLIDLFPELRQQYAQSLTDWKMRSNLERPGESSNHILH